MRSTELSTEPQGRINSAGNDTDCWIYVFTNTREIPTCPTTDLDCLLLHTHTQEIPSVQNSWVISYLGLCLEKQDPDRQIGRPAHGQTEAGGRRKEGSRCSRG